VHRDLYAKVSKLRRPPTRASYQRVRNFDVAWPPRDRTRKGAGRSRRQERTTLQFRLIWWRHPRPVTGFPLWNRRSPVLCGRGFSMQANNLTRACAHTWSKRGSKSRSAKWKAPGCKGHQGFQFTPRTGERGPVRERLSANQLNFNRVSS
jgi:hypothetical protein